MVPLNFLFLSFTGRCRSGKCIDKLKLCDGIFKDCEEGEDEDLDYCSHVHNCPETHPFKCDYGICISERMLCDGSYNCLDATDELVCGRRSCPAERPFKCLNGLCISMDKVQLVLFFFLYLVHENM